MYKRTFQTLHHIRNGSELNGIRETKGIILFTKDFKEKDKLVKIFTESLWKIDVFVKGAHRKIIPFASDSAIYRSRHIGNFREEGLSFLNSSKEVQPRNIQQDIFINAYGTYILNLVDAAIEDQHYDPNLFQFTHMALSALNEQKIRKSLQIFLKFNC